MMESTELKPIKPNESTNLKSEHSNDEKERTDAINSIFYNPQNENHDIFLRAGEIDSTNKTNGLDDYSGRNFDIRSDFGGPMSESLPDLNLYQNKKTVAQGMMDLALFSANANQLRYVLESNNHPYYYPGLLLISISLIVQVAIGVGLLLNTRYNVKSEKEVCIANKINNFTVVGIFLVTVINVFISAFGVASSGVAIVPTLGNRSGENGTVFENGTISNTTTFGNFTDYFGIFSNSSQ